MIRKIKLFLGIYNLREEFKLYCIKEFGKECGNEFLQKYDDINQGMPIGNMVETVAFLNLVDYVKSELESKSVWKILKKQML